MPPTLTSKNRVLAAIEEGGPMSSIELAEYLGWHISFARSAVAYCRKKEPKVLYIKSYSRNEDHGKLYPRAVYALGDLPDHPKPKKLKRKILNARHRAKKRKLISSVFELGEAVDTRRLTTRKRPDVAEILRNRARKGVGAP